MRGTAIVSIVCLACALGGCASQSLPFYVDGGSGSEKGNYGLRPDGETTSATGEHCVFFTWDRPLSPDTILRIKSSSCGTASRMVPREISRTVIPVTQSNPTHAEQAGPSS